MSIPMYLTVILVTALCVFVLWRISVKQKREYDNLVNAYRQLEKWNTQLRAQRHDHLNQLHVISGLLEGEEYDALRDYIKPICHELERTGKAIRTDSAAINALFAAKIGEAERNGVHLILEVSSSLAALPLPDWDLVRILANLIDNAITASLRSDETEKTPKPTVTVQVSENACQYLFEVRNNGAGIPEENRERIFSAGFSTKKESGHGMGLYIVKQLLQKYHGMLTWRSDDIQTVFQICFRKEVQT